MQPKKKDGLIIEEVGEELLVFDDSAQVAAALNRAAAAVFELCDGTRDVDGIVADLRTHTPPLGRDEVALALEELDEAGLIDDVPDVSNPGRRALLAKLGAGAAAAMALPVVEALVAPSPAHAASVQPPSYQPPSTLAPTLSPTQGPTLAPTSGPTPAPTEAPTSLRHRRRPRLRHSLRHRRRPRLRHSLRHRRRLWFPSQPQAGGIAGTDC